MLFANVFIKVICLPEMRFTRKFKIFCLLVLGALCVPESIRQPRLYISYTLDTYDNIISVRYSRMLLTSRLVINWWLAVSLIGL